MSTRMEWKAPQAAVERDEQTFKKMHASIWPTAIKTISIAAPVALVVACFVGTAGEGTADFARSFGQLLLLIFTVPLLFCLLLWSVFRLPNSGDRYEVSEKGLRRRGMRFNWLVAWRQVASYSFRENENAPGLRVLAVSFRPSRLDQPVGDAQRHVELPFDPREVDEDHIQQILQRHLH